MKFLETLTNKEMIMLLMMRKNVSMTELAEMLHVTRQTISTTLRKPDINDATFLRYAKQLDTSVYSVCKIENKDKKDESDEEYKDIRYLPKDNPLPKPLP